MRGPCAGHEGANAAIVRDTRVVKATGLQGDALREIIEIIDDDTDIFGDRAPNVTIHDTGGPRWVGPVAAAALIGLIGYGVATSSSTSGVPTVAPAASTIAAPSTTQPAPTTTIPEPLVPYYAADPPRQFTVEFAETTEPQDSYHDPGGYQLWATTGATASSGSWFAIENYAGRGASFYATDAYRVETARQSIAISRTSYGQTIAQFLPGRSEYVTITSFGLSDEETIRLADAVTVDGDTTEVSDPTLVADYQMISRVHPWFAVQGIPVEQIFYSDSDDPVNDLSITVALRPSPSEGGATLDRQIALRFFLDHATPFGVDGHVAVAGSVIGQFEYSLATWIAGNHIVTLSANMPVPELISIARTVHEVSADEWDGMKFQAARLNRGDNPGDYEASDPTPVAFGSDADSKSWTVRASMATFDDEPQQINWAWNGNGFASSPSVTPTISTVVENDRTYVLADLPRAVAGEAQLQITRAGLEPVVVPFVDTDPNFDRTFAAYAFSEPTPYTAQIVGSDGAVLASWPST